MVILQKRVILYCLRRCSSFSLKAHHHHRGRWNSSIAHLAVWFPSRSFTQVPQKSDIVWVSPTIFSVQLLSIQETKSHKAMRNGTQQVIRFQWNLCIGVCSLYYFCRFWSFKKLIANHLEMSNHERYCLFIATQSRIYQWHSRIGHYWTLVSYIVKKFDGPNPTNLLTTPRPFP